MLPRSRDGAPPAQDGLVVVDKPGGWTSHDVVARLRRLARTTRVGHAGTLDPMATGVLVVGVGAATRLLHHLVLTDKEYTATVRLGMATVSDDAEGEPLSTTSAAHVHEDAVRAAMLALTGDIEQVPSAVSAIKVDGRRAHERVRAGETPDLPPRPVTVSRFDALTFARPEPDVLDVEVAVTCSSGTYVRALARDLGAALGVGGHLTALRRTRVGPFGLDTAETLDELAGRDDPVTLSLVQAVRTAFPVRPVDAVEARELSFGRPLAATGHPGVHAAVSGTGDESDGGGAVAVALLRDEGDRARPVLVFTPAG